MFNTGNCFNFMYLEYTKGKSTNEILEEVIHVNEDETTSLKKANRHWNNFFKISLFNHLYEKIARSRKLGSIISVLTIEEDQVVVGWVLTMQKVQLSIDQ